MAGKKLTMKQFFKHIGKPQPTISMRRFTLAEWYVIFRMKPKKRRKKAA